VRVIAERTEAITGEIVDAQTLLELCRIIYPPEKEALGVVVLEIRPVKIES
jgi:hypothetical protein